MPENRFQKVLTNRMLFMSFQTLPVINSYLKVKGKVPFYHLMSAALGMVQIIKHSLLTFVGRSHQPGVTQWAKALAFLLSIQGLTQFQPSWNSSG